MLYVILLFAGCDDDYEYELESCYKLFSNTKNYDDAQASCEAEGATLVEIESQEEQDLAIGMLSELTRVRRKYTSSGFITSLYMT